jgi:hypothetical protein
LKEQRFLEWHHWAAKGKSGLMARTFNLTCGGKVVYMIIKLRIVFRAIVLIIRVKL